MELPTLDLWETVLAKEEPSAKALRVPRSPAHEHVEAELARFEDNVRVLHKVVAPRHFDQAKRPRVKLPPGLADPARPIHPTATSTVAFPMHSAGFPAVYSMGLGGWVPWYPAIPGPVHMHSVSRPMLGMDGRVFTCHPAPPSVALLDPIILPAEPEISRVILVPEVLVGAIVGRGGKSLQYAERRSGAKIQIQDVAETAAVVAEGSGVPYTVVPFGAHLPQRAVLMSGPAGAVRDAAGLMNRKVSVLLRNWLCRQQPLLPHASYEENLDAARVVLLQLRQGSFGQQEQCF